VDSPGDIVLFNNHLVLYKSSIDLTFYIVGPEHENELMLSNVLLAFHDAVSMLLRHQVEKRSVLENLDLVVLALDETVDDGWVYICPRAVLLLTQIIAAQHYPRDGLYGYRITMLTTARRSISQPERTQNRRGCKC
jgi:hypothetical protein